MKKGACTHCSTIWEWWVWRHSLLMKQGQDMWVQTTLINGMTLSTMLSHAIERRCEIPNWLLWYLQIKQWSLCSSQRDSSRHNEATERWAAGSTAQKYHWVECSMDWISGMVAFQKQNGPSNVLIKNLCAMLWNTATSYYQPLKTYFRTCPKPSVHHLWRQKGFLAC